MSEDSAYGRGFAHGAVLVFLVVMLVILIDIGAEPEPVRPVVHRQPLPEHVTQVQPAEFFAPREYAGELNGVCANPDEPDWPWTELDQKTDTVYVSCTLPQRFPRQTD